ncbi:hypothetical protein IAD21_01956 [Abditibacteriota bacterium]|nr:hypothetical protein IAD21_01956 [Abditibacteriota bacterium]
MKTRLFLALLGASAVTLPTFSSLALAKDGELEDNYSKTWKGVATLRTLSKNEKTREMKASYPVFSGLRSVAQVAGLVLKKDAINGFNAFAKDSKGTAQQLGLHDGMKYQYDFEPSLVLNRPRFISATTMFYSFTAGAHGIYGTSGYVFGYPKGATRPRQLHLADFFTDGAASKRRIDTLLIAKLRATKGQDQEATWIVDGETKTLTNDLLENFVAESDGLKWYFGPYAVGPYAAGEFEVKLTARELGPKFRAAMMR